LAVAGLFGAAVGDVLRLVNWDLREALLFSSETLGVWAARFGLRMAMGAAIAALVWAGLRKGRGLLRLPGPAALMAGLVLMLGMHGATDVLQRTTAHSTTYAYGLDYQNFRAVVGQLEVAERKRPGQFWVVPPHLSFAAGLRDYPEMVWDDPDRMRRAMSDARTQGLVVGRSSNSARTFREVLADAEVREVLSASFQQSTIGEYSLWIRR